MIIPEGSSNLKVASALVEPPAYEDVFRQAGSRDASIARRSASLLTVPDVPRPQSPPPSQSPSSPRRGWSLSRKLSFRSERSMSSSPSIVVSRPAAPGTVSRAPAQPPSVFTSLGSLLGALLSAIRSKHAAKQLRRQEKRNYRQAKRGLKSAFHQVKRDWKATKREHKRVRRAARHARRVERGQGACCGRRRFTDSAESQQVREYKGYSSGRGCGRHARQMTQVSTA